MQQSMSSGSVTTPKGYKISFMLNQTEHDIYTAHEYQNANNGWQININEQDNQLALMIKA